MANQPLAAIIDHWAVQPCPNTGCWIWSASRTAAGYAALTIAQKNHLGHRLAYELEYGAIPDGMHVCHRCNNPYCVNPDHLFLGTPQENMGHRDACKRNPRGERVGSAKLTSAAVKAIREMLSSGVRGQDIADKYKVGLRTILDIDHGVTWKDVA
jgi:hypothetical protein